MIGLPGRVFRTLLFLKCRGQGVGPGCVSENEATADLPLALLSLPTLLSWLFV